MKLYQIKKLFGQIALCLLLIFYCAGAQAANISGDYNKEYHEFTEDDKYIETGLLRVEELLLGKIYFSISAASGYSSSGIASGQVRGTIKLNGNVATFLPGEGNCQLTLTFFSNEVVITQNKALGNCGLLPAVNIAGKYRKTESIKQRYRGYME